MKSALMIVIVFALLLAACQSAAPTETEAPAPVETLVLTPAPAEPTPEPAGDEPYPGAQDNTDAAPPYPGPEQGSTPVVWDEATKLILDGKVVQVTQYDNLIVILVLEDGQIVSTREPVIDEVFNLIKECGDPCKDIEVPTN